MLEYSPRVQLVCKTATVDPRPLGPFKHGRYRIGFFEHQTAAGAKKMEENLDQMSIPYDITHTSSANKVKRILNLYGIKNINYLPLYQKIENRHLHDGYVDWWHHVSSNREHGCR